LYDQTIGINQVVTPGSTLCFAARWLGEDETIFRSVHKHGRKSMVKKAWKLLNEADACVHFNGTRFDIPILHTEFVLAGLAPPSPHMNIDLLTAVRSRFKFTSNKMDFVARMLEIEGKTDHKGMALWIGCINGNAEDWEVMETYNRNDIDMTEKIYHRIKPWLKTNLNMAMFTDSDEMVCPSCGSHDVQKRGIVYTKTNAKQRYVCNACGTWSSSKEAVLSKEKRKNLLTTI
jgi:transposase-like protein